MTPDDRTPDDATRDGPSSDAMAATEDRLRATLRGVAAGATPTDGLEHLRAATSEPAGAPGTPDSDRSPAADTVVLDLPTPRTATPGRLRGWLTAAAVIAAVVGIGALLTTIDLGGNAAQDVAASGGALTDAPTTGENIPTTDTTRPNDPEQPGPGTDPNDSRTVVEEPWEFPEQFDPLEGLTFTLIVDQSTVGAGHAVGARLQITNTTTAHRTIHECSAIQTGIAFVPASDPGGEVPVPQIIDCYRTPTLEIPPGDTVDLPFAVNGYPAPLSARRHGVHDGMTVPLGALPPGAYLATAVMPGSDRAVRVQTPVTITEPACDGFTDELARAVLWKTEAEATDEAQALGFTLRPVIIDSVGQAVTDDLRCDRVNVAVGSGRVIDITSLG